MADTHTYSAPFYTPYTGRKEAEEDQHNGKATAMPWGCLQLAVLIDDSQPGSYRHTAIAYWDHAKQRMRLEYSVIMSVHLSDCLAGFDSGTLVAYGDSIPELRAIAERELPLLVAAIERRVRMAMGDDSVPPPSILGDT